jgi:hypothetical protein
MTNPQPKPTPQAEPTDEVDPFLERRVFPDPTAVFSFRLKSLDEIKETCLVVLDTNVLLVPYTISPKTLEEIKSTYQKLLNKHRLLIPAHVVREFAKNRARKLSELFQQLTLRRNSFKFMQSGSYPLLEGMPAYTKARDLEQSIDASLREYQRELDDVLSSVKAWKWDDPVSMLYSELFKQPAIREVTIEDHQLEQDCDERRRDKRPPGYKDAAKPTNALGDLLIWHTILELGESEQKSVILVSGDGKPDWWHQSAGQPLYPRFELVEEFRRRSGGQSFHITKFSDFLDLFGAEEAVVQEVRNEEALVKASRFASTSDMRAHAQAVKELVRRWLELQYPDCQILEADDTFADFLLVSPAGKQTPVSVIASRQSQPFLVIRRLREVGYRAFYESRRTNSNSVLIVAVFPSAESAQAFSGTASKMVAKGPPLSVSIGYIDANLGYVEVSRSVTLGM